jgi:hypothetical protein
MTEAREPDREPVRASTRTLPAAEPCRNCGDPTPGRYCPSCGQRKVEVRVSVHALLADVLEDQLVLNRALPRTLAALLLHPGRLTNEYIRGRIVRYVAPFRLYLAASVVFFLVISFLGLRALERQQFGHAPGGAAVDSLRADLARKQEVLERTDTAALGEVPRAIVRQARANYTAALELLGDPGRPLDHAMYVNIVNLTRGAVPLGEGEMQPWAQEITMEGAPALLREGFRRKLAAVGHLPPREAARRLLADALEYAPHAVFMLLPLYALLLKALYIRRGRYYAEHFVFALHVHAFFFLMFLLMIIVPWGRVNGLLALWMVVYMWLAMKHVYRQGWFRTTIKAIVLSWTYGMLMLLTAVGLVFAALFV